MRIYGKMMALLFFENLFISAFYLAIISQFHKY